MGIPVLFYFIKRSYYFVPEFWNAPLHMFVIPHHCHRVYVCSNRYWTWRTLWICVTLKWNHISTTFKGSFKDMLYTAATSCCRI